MLFGHGSDDGDGDGDGYGQGTANYIMHSHTYKSESGNVPIREYRSSNNHQITMLYYLS